MEIFQMMIEYFGLDLISEAQTFPELLQAFLYSLFAMFIVTLIIRAMFSASWKIQQSFSNKR